MPSSIVTSFANKSGKSVDKVEKLWNKIKDSVKNGGTPESDDSFYGRVVSGLKRALKIEEKTRFKEFKECVDGETNR